MERRGAGHIEIILAFVLFVAFVGIALYFFSPTNTSRLVDTALIYTFDEVEDNATMEIDVVGVKMNVLDPVIAVVILDIDTEKKVRVEDGDGNILSSGREGNKVTINRGDADFVFVMFAEDFMDMGEPGVNHESNYYEIASTDTREVFSEKRFMALRENYLESDATYRSIKEEFNLPDRVDFGADLLLTESDGTVTTISLDKAKPERFEVFSDSKRIEVLRESGELSFGELRVKIW
jgi:hypothetical protein